MLYYLNPRDKHITNSTLKANLLLYIPFMNYGVFIYSRSTMHRKLDSGISSFEKGIMAGIWTQHVTSVCTWNYLVLCKLKVRILIF
jgi:hypothetical protein